METQQGAHIIALPTEIIWEIFLHCLPSIKESSAHAPERYAPLLLLRICRIWREIALSIPTLWTTLYLCHIPIFNTHEVLTTVEKFSRGVDAWIGRSGELPLSIEIRCSRVYPYLGPRVYQLLQLTINRLAHRLRSFELEMPFLLFSNIFAKASGTFPLLQDLTIRVMDESHGFWTSLLTEAPQLRYVHQCQLYGGDAAFVLPWGQLTTFVGQITSLDILKLAPALLHATLILERAFEYEVGVVVCHARLQTLVLPPRSELRWGFRAPSVLESLTLPALQNLDIRETDSYDVDDADEASDSDYTYGRLRTPQRDASTTASIFASFLARSSPPLRTLSLCFDTYDRELGAYLRSSLHTLEHLHIFRRLDRFAADFLPLAESSEHALLSWLAAEGAAYLPHLKELVFRAGDQPGYESLVWSVSEWSRQQSSSERDCEFPAIRVVCEKGFYERGKTMPPSDFMWSRTRHAEICGV
ncbi:hypothetical protein B0H11DRAFT_234881 [Mycena galericulata]|nr:hypothetical protein B0H11DRAFT_234881 [Mycena galericulata]